MQQRTTALTALINWLVLAVPACPDAHSPFDDVEQLRWRGPNDTFAAYVTKLGDARLLQRCQKAQGALA